MIKHNIVGCDSSEDLCPFRDAWPLGQKTRDGQVLHCMNLYDIYIYIHIVIYIYYTYMIYLCNDTRVSSTNCVYTLNMKYKYTYICADVYPQWNFKTINGEPVAEIPTLRL